MRLRGSHSARFWTPRGSWLSPRPPRGPIHRTIQPCSRATTYSRARFVGPRGPIHHGTAGATASATRRVVARSSLSRARRPFRLSRSRPQGASRPQRCRRHRRHRQPSRHRQPQRRMLFKCRVNREPRAGPSLAATVAVLTAEPQRIGRVRARALGCECYSTHGAARRLTRPDARTRLRASGNGGGGERRLALGRRDPQEDSVRRRVGGDMGRKCG